MEKTEAGERRVETFTADERRRIENAMNFRFNAYLKPGESISVDAEVDDEYIYSELALEAGDESFRLELESAVLAADQGAEVFPRPGDALDQAFEFLKLRLYEFFQSSRTERFHIDWRHYTVNETAVRFRGQMRKPELESRADEMLEDAEFDEAGFEDVDALDDDGDRTP
jgi:hypothetical protein